VRENFHQKMESEEREDNATVHVELGVLEYGHDDSQMRTHYRGQMLGENSTPQPSLPHHSQPTNRADGHNILLQRDTFSYSAMLVTAADNQSLRMFSINHNAVNVSDDFAIYSNLSQPTGEKRQGLGVLKYSNNALYEGEWNDDKAHGFGCETMSSGEVYRGQFVLGQRAKKGVLYNLDGTVFAGCDPHFIQCGATLPGRIEAPSREYFRCSLNAS
jgi:hypothetical protein